MRRLPPLAAVRVFECAARHENFTQAAQELGMTQAAVSYQIRVLEERLGLPLFHRSKQRVTLTDAGRRTAIQVTSAFDDLARAFDAIVADDGTVLSISTAPTFASSWLAPRLGTFQVAQPDLAVRLGSEDRLVDLGSGEADIAIRIGAGPWPGMVQHFLFRSHVTPICSADFLQQHEIAQPDHLPALPRISDDDAWWKLWFNRQGVSLDGEVRRRAVGFDSQLGEMRAVMAGHGVALMTPLFWQPEIEAGRLVQPFEDLLLLDNSYWLVYPEHKRNQAKIRAFRNWLAGEMKAASRGVPPEVFTAPARYQTSAG